MTIEAESDWGDTADKWAAIQLQTVYRQWADEAGNQVEAKLRAKAPRSKSPGGGRFASTIRHRVVFTAGRKAIEFFSRLPYAQFIQAPTQAHDIKPKNARALMWPGAKHPSRIVHHPGTKGNKFAEEVLAAEKSNVESSLIRLISDALR